MADDKKKSQEDKANNFVERLFQKLSPLPGSQSNKLLNDVKRKLKEAEKNSGQK